MKETPPYGKLELMLGAVAIVGMCAVFYLWPGSDFEVKTTRIGPRDNGVHGTEETYPHSLLPGEKIPINTADWYDLSRLPGMGADTAQAVVDHRERHGPFKRLEQLRLVKGINARRWAQMKEYICLYEDSK